MLKESNLSKADNSDIQKSYRSNLKKTDRATVVIDNVTKYIQITGRPVSD